MLSEDKAPAAPEESELRPGEMRFPLVGPAADATLQFIGRIRSPWRQRADCPKNVREARERGSAAWIEVSPGYRAALAGLEAGQFAWLLTWLDRARRDLALQMPRHAAEPRGTFSLRSPVRPNPIGLHLVRIVALDAASGRIDIDAIDVLDETPLIDIKPFLPSVDLPPGWAAPTAG